MLSTSLMMTTQKPITPKRDSPSGLEQALLAQTQSAQKIPDKIFVQHLTQYFKALTQLLNVEENGPELSVHSPKKTNFGKKSK